jgi:hypothetical protein
MSKKRWDYRLSLRVEGTETETAGLRGKLAALLRMGFFFLVTLYLFTSSLSGLSRLHFLVRLWGRAHE